MTSGAAAWLYRHRGTTAVPFAVAAILGARPSPPAIAAGIALIALGQLLRLWAVTHIGAHSRGRTLRAPTLVTTGPYALMRHPLYFGNALLSTGILVASGAFMPWLPLMFIPAFLVQYVVFIRSEEAFLAAERPGEWSRYANRVPCFLPRAAPPGGPFFSRAALRTEWPTIRTVVGLGVLMALRSNFPTWRS